MFRVVIGQDVEHVYDQVCEIAGLSKEAAIEELLDKELVQEKKGIKSIADSFFYIVGTMTPIITILISASLWSAIGLLLRIKILKK